MHGMPDQRNQKRTVNSSVTLLGFSVAFSLFGDMAIYSILPVFHQELGFSALQVGILLSANRWIRLLTNHLARKVLSRHHPPVLLAAALVLGSAIAGFYSFQPGFVLFLGARILWGLCWSFIRHTGVMTSIGTSAEKTAGRTIGVYQGIVQLGFIAGTFSGALLFDLIGFSKTFIVMAAVSLIAVPFDIAGFKPLRGKEHLTMARHESRKMPDIALIIRGFIVSCVGTGFIMSTLGFTLKRYLGESVSVGSIVIGIATLNGILLSFRYVINSVGSPLIGTLIDRFGRLKAETVAFTLGAIILILGGIFTRSAALVPLVLAFFVFSTTAWIALNAEAGLKGSKNFSYLVTSTDLGAAVGPLLGWIGIESFDKPSIIFLAGGALFTIAALLTVFSAEESRVKKGR
jgi:predicted MFS family arabinose efflux permease